MSQKTKEDVSSYFDHVISTIASTFAREGSLDSAFMGVGPSSDWGLLNLRKTKIFVVTMGDAFVLFMSAPFPF